MRGGGEEESSGAGRQNRVTAVVICGLLLPSSSFSFLVSAHFPLAPSGLRAAFYLSNEPPIPSFASSEGRICHAVEEVFARSSFICLCVCGFCLASVCVGGGVGVRAVCRCIPGSPRRSPGPDQYAALWPFANGSFNLVGHIWNT